MLDLSAKAIRVALLIVCKCRGGARHKAGKRGPGINRTRKAPDSRRRASGTLSSLSGDGEEMNPDASRGRQSWPRWPAEYGAGAGRIRGKTYSTKSEAKQPHRLIRLPSAEPAFLNVATGRV